MSTEKQRKFLQGNEACVEGALYAGCTFFAGYPITPSTEVMEIMGMKLPPQEGRFIQMEDEIASISAITGASAAGRKVMTSTSGPGFSLMQEGLGYACMTELPMVIVNVMRSGPSTGYPTGPSQGDVMQAKWGAHGDHPAIALVPASVQELLYETIRAFNLAEKYRTPVIVLYDEVIGHMREAVIIPERGEFEIIDRVKPNCAIGDYKPYDLRHGEIPPLAAFGDGHRFHITGLFHAEDGFPTADQQYIHDTTKRLVNKVEHNIDDICENEELFLDDAEIGVFAYGVSSKSAKFAVKALREKGVKVGLLRPKTIWPFPAEAVRKMADQVKRIIVPEMNLGQVLVEVERAAGCRCEVESILRVDTEPIHPNQIMGKVLGHDICPTTIPDSELIERDMMDG